MAKTIKFKLDEPLIGLDKKPMQEDDGKGGKKTVTMGNVIASQIVMLTGLEPKDSIRVYKISQEMYDAKEMNLEEEKLDFIETQFNKAPIPAISGGQVRDYIRTVRKQFEEPATTTK